MAETMSPFRDLRSEEIDTLKPRERILKTAIRLFNEHDVHTIGIDRIIAESLVSKRTFYSYFPSKSELIGAYLDFWDAYRFNNLEKHLAGSKNADPEAQVLAVFDALEDWIRQSDFNGCMFTRGLNDFSAEDAGELRGKVEAHFKKAADFIAERLKLIFNGKQAEAVLPQLLSLIVGAMVVAHISGDASIARSNKQIAAYLLNH